MREKSIELLNKAVADELTAVHQYMYFHFHADDQGLDLLAGLFKKTAIDEMIHVETLAERILFLGGDVDMNSTKDIEQIRDISEMLAKAKNMEDESVKEYNEWANICSKNADSGTKKLFEHLVEDEENHFDTFDLELEKLEKYGDNYLALQSMESSKSEE